jgi:hypothetical protein
MPEITLSKTPSMFDQIARRGVKENALELPDNLTFGEYEAIGLSLSYIHTGAQWWWGDFLLFGEEHYEDDYLQAIPLSGLEAKTVDNYKYVCRAFPPESRRPNLSFSHHETVATRKLNPVQREKLLDMAEKEQWDRDEFRDEVKKLLGAAEQLTSNKPKITLDYPVTVTNLAAVIETHLNESQRHQLITELGGYMDVDDLPEKGDDDVD